MSRILLILLLLLASLVQHVLSTDKSIDASGDNKENQSYRDKAKELAARISSAFATDVKVFAAICFLVLFLVFGGGGILNIFGILVLLINLARSAGPGGVIGLTFIIVAWYYFGG